MFYCLSLTYFTLHDVPQVHPGCCQWQDFLLLWLGQMQIYFNLWSLLSDLGIWVLRAAEHNVVSQDSSLTFMLSGGGSQGGARRGGRCQEMRSYSSLEGLALGYIQHLNYFIFLLKNYTIALFKTKVIWPIFNFLNCGKVHIT